MASNEIKAKVYQVAQALACANGQDHHLAALLWRRGKLIRIGTNGKQSAAFKKYYSGDQSNTSYFSHAESDALLRSESVDRLEILRWTKRGILTMAKPCEFCQSLIRQSELASVRYTNWEGQWSKFTLKN